jgi:hypothetical protein
MEWVSSAGAVSSWSQVRPSQMLVDSALSRFCSYGAVHLLSELRLKCLSLTFEYVTDFLCALSKPLLKPADKLVILSLGVG